jgi:hypothetical protein
MRRDIFFRTVLATRPARAPDPSRDQTNFQKNRHAASLQRAEMGALLHTPGAASHTDTLALSTLARWEHVDVVVQQVDGGFQADALHRVEWQEACPPVTVVSLAGAVICQHPCHHRYGKRSTGAL